MNRWALAQTPGLALPRRPTTRWALLLGLAIGICDPGFEARAAEPEWRSYYAADAGFRVDVPAEVVHETDENWSISGNIILHRYTIEYPGARLDVECHSIPRVAVWAMSSSRLLDLARNGLMKHLGVEPESEQEIVLQGYPGRKLLFRRPHLPGPEETRIYLAGRHLYLVAAGPWDPDSRKAVVDRFFDSLRLCPTDSKDCGSGEPEPAP